MAGRSQVGTPSLGGAHPRRAGEPPGAGHLTRLTFVRSRSPEDSFDVSRFHTPVQGVAGILLPAGAQAEVGTAVLRHPVPGNIPEFRQAGARAGFEQPAVGRCRGQLAAFGSVSGTSSLLVATEDQRQILSQPCESAPEQTQSIVTGSSHPCHPPRQLL